MTPAADPDRVRAEFIEKVGLIAQGEGLPRTAGRLFGLLVFDGQAVPFGALATQLQVSRGGVSASVRLLEERGLIKRVTRPGERQDYFQLAADPYAGLLTGARRRVVEARDEIAATIRELPEDAPDIRQRLMAYADFYDAIDGGLADALVRLTQGARCAPEREPK